jgi:hypothetical protein
MKTILTVLLSWLLLVGVQSDEVKFQPTTYSPPASLTIQTGVPLLGTWDFSGATVTGLTPASGGTPGGATTQVQFNDAGAFNGATELAYNKATKQLEVSPGSQAAPGLSFFGSNNGIYYAGGGIGNFVGVSVSNVTNLVVTGSASYGVIIPNILQFQAGWDGGYSGPDVALQHSAAGALEVNNGTKGTLADVKLRNLIASGTVTGNGSVPVGGATNQVLTKNSNADYDYSWKARNATKIVWLTTVGSSTFTPDSGVRSLYVEVIGGGGGSAGALGTGSSGASAGGGAGGSYAAKYYASPAASYTYTIGGAGSAGAATPTAGGKGGDTTFGTTTPLTGFGGGGSAIPVAGTAAGLSGNGGSPTGGSPSSNGDVFIAGSAGCMGIRYSASGGLGGYGGNSTWGGSSASAGSLNFAGQPGLNYGGGAAGATSGNATGQAGAAGGQGAIKVTEAF